ncbi:alpha-aspartyl dipeptidase [Rhipicephalus sanguineus]|uniref:alpha-aspartyl dipeptidase n=1 Tax=Rhipicephalus sanguineus TaxID=34632 RepID=UPI001896014D|nr:alpha-aspartyl dipeptidase [Rhipicephalus sanguineus]
MSSSSSSSMAAPRRLLLLSNSTMYNGEFLEFAADTVKDFFKKSATKRILFVPYARKDYADYAAKVKARLGEMGFEVDSIHEAADPVSAVKMAQGIFIGGGNTFRLLKTLYESNTAEAIRIRCLEDGMPYMGASAGTNVATANICTTNDMPIFYPPTFVALRLVPFNINPHYIETDPDSKHMGETRDQRIDEYLEVGNHLPVLGLKEGAILKVEGNHAVLLGNEAKLFKENVDPVYYKPGADMSFLLTDTNA